MLKLSKLMPPLSFRVASCTALLVVYRINSCLFGSEQWRKGNIAEESRARLATSPGDPLISRLQIIRLKFGANGHGL